MLRFFACGQRILLDSSRDLGPRFGFEDRRCQDVQIFCAMGGGSATLDPVADLFHRPTQQHPTASSAHVDLLQSRHPLKVFLGGDCMRRKT